MKTHPPVYVCGTVDQLGFTHDSATISKPKNCQYNIQVKQVACGDAHTHLLSVDGHVYSMGHNKKGVLGLDTLSVLYQKNPQLMRLLSDIVQVATGNCHSLALDS